MPRSRKRRGGEFTTIHVPDLSDVEGRVVIPEDRYTFEIVKVEEGEGDSGAYYKWTFAVVGGKYDGKKAKPYITSLAPEALWNLRNLLEGLEVDIPKKAFDLEVEEFIGMKFIAGIIHDTYEGRTQSEIDGNFEPVGDEDSGKDKGSKKKRDKEDDEDDDRSSRRKKNKNKKEEVNYSQDEVNEMDEEELADVIKTHDLDVDLEDYKTLRKQRLGVIDALEKAELMSDD